MGLGIRETPIAQSFCAHAIRNEGPLVVCDANKDVRFATNELVVSSPHIKFYAGFPLHSSEGIALGAFCILDDHARPGGLLPSEHSALQVLAAQVEAQLELRRAVKERDAQLLNLHRLTKDLRHAAAHDPLTSLPNRALLSVRLEEGIAASDKSSLPLTLMLIDVDHFKQVNDSMGHDAGDALLLQFAQNLTHVIRSSDTAARNGGDEFALLLAETDEGDITALLASLSKRLAIPLIHR
ncbi:MAG: sensor domain-containing diguanylate cyclase, partial [Pseudomonadota bacterium]|nr:sensor domain-containing diguanylate cyclase [Pseudomonadota bacterium]